MRVLIVDDVEMNCDLVAKFLEGHAATISAGTGEEAVSLVQTALQKDSYFDLICMDIELPGINGHEALKTIRRMEQEHGGVRAKVFMITGSSDPDDMIDALVEGDCDDYLTKPLMKHALMDLLDKHGL